MNILKNPTKGMLILQDGSIFEGYSFGAEGTAVAKAVYHTSVVGFVENLTTPSNVDNIVVQTFPLYGNYGVCYEDLESSHIAKGIIVREWCDTPSNYRMETDINTFLKEKNVIGLYNLDTRALTKKLRDSGSMLGVITTDNNIITNPDNAKNLFPNFAPTKRTYSSVRQVKSEKGEYNVSVIDFGLCKSTENAMLDNGFNLTIYSADACADDIVSKNPDGIIISGGYGNPATDDQGKNLVKQLVEKNIPTLAFDYGYWLLAGAMGADIAEIKSGHRGANIPVIDLESSKTLVTSQNSGYTVSKINEENMKVSHINSNTKEIEGIAFTKYNAVATQFIPDANMDRKNEDGMYVYFAKMMKNGGLK